MNVGTEEIQKGPLVDSNGESLALVNEHEAEATLLEKPVWDRQRIIHDPKETKYDSDADIKLSLAQAKHNYDEIGFLEEMYQYFLQATQVQAKRALNFVTFEQWEAAGSPKWTVKSKFEDFLNDAKLYELPYQLDDLKRQRQKHKDGMPILFTLPGISTIIDIKKDIGSYDYNAPDPALEKPMDPEIIEIADFVCRKNIETIEKFQRGEIKLPTPKVDQDTALKISGLDDVLSENAKDRFVDNIKKIKQK